MNETKLTHAQIETLQYILDTHISSLDVKYDDLLSLKNKLILMRAELEYNKPLFSSDELYGTSKD